MMFNTCFLDFSSLRHLLFKLFNLTVIFFRKSIIQKPPTFSFLLSLKSRCLFRRVTLKRCNISTVWLLNLNWYRCCRTIFIFYSMNAFCLIYCGLYFVTIVLVLMHKSFVNTCVIWKYASICYTVSLLHTLSPMSLLYCFSIDHQAFFILRSRIIVTCRDLLKLNEFGPLNTTVFLKLDCSVCGEVFPNIKSLCAMKSVHPFIDSNQAFFSHLRIRH